MSLEQQDAAAAAVAVAPRVTLADIEAKIASKSVVLHPAGAPVLTVVILTTTSGFHVTGESACASPENFNADLGEEIAYKQAVGKLWGFEGYLLRERLNAAA